MSEKKDNNNLFRDKSLAQFTSPEQLNDYIQVIHPSLILFLMAIISLLVGVIIWGYLGSINSEEKVTSYVNNSSIHAYLQAADASELSIESVILVGEKEYSITSVSTAAKAGMILNEDELAMYKLSSDDLVVALIGETDLPNGVYEATVIMKRMRPIDLILN